MVNAGAQALHCVVLGFTSEANGGAITSADGKTHSQVKKIISNTH